jgi:hypothetical protein
MVETVWFELPTPHPVIEPVSDTRVRNGNFRCRDRGPKWPHSRRLQEQRLRQPENLADMSLTSRRIASVYYSIQLQSVRGGRTRARTWDPMIKSGCLCISRVTRY